MYKKNLLLFLFICSFAAVGSVETVFGSNAEAGPGNPPPEVYLSAGNWNYLPMSHGCVQLPEEQVLKITFMFTAGVADISPFTPVYYNTHFYDGSQDVTLVPITNTDLTPLTFTNGYTVYTFTKDVFVKSFESQCLSEPTKLVDFEYSITLTDVNGNPYPIESNAGLLIPTPPTNPPGGEDPMDPIEPTISYAGTKDVCCYESSGGGQQSAVQNTGGQITVSEANGISGIGDNNTEVLVFEKKFDNTIKINNFQEATISPNPFDENLTIKFQSKIASNTSIQLWDINGKLVHQYEYASDISGIQEIELRTNYLENGFYYCSLRNNNESRSFKVLKISR